LVDFRGFIMTPEKAAYIRSLSSEGLQNFKLSALWRFTNARRALKQARAALDEQRAEMRFIDQVMKERAIGNVVEFPVKTIQEPAVKQRNWRRR
jgi:hypothetical protein